MKGVNKRVVEITEPQNENIERVLVFFKTDSEAVRAGSQQAEAEKYVAGLVCWHASIWPFDAKDTRIMLIAGAVLACLSGVLWLLL